MKEREEVDILNIFYSATGNTEKVARRIEQVLQGKGHQVETVKVGEGDIAMDILQYDLVFAGSGVYSQLPGKPLMELFTSLLRRYVKEGEIKPASPRRAGAKAVIYCTYGGVHTGSNEALPAVKYMGQLFDHLGYEIVGEWYIVGEYKTKELKNYSVSGRLGDIRGRPGEQDLNEVAQLVNGIMKVF